MDVCFNQSSKRMIWLEQFSFFFQNNIYLLIFDAMFHIQYQIIPVPKFLADSAQAFSFMRFFVNSIVYSVSNRLLYCLFIEVDFGK